MIVYLDDGIFKLRVLGDTQLSNEDRGPEEIKESELNINRELIYEDDDPETK